MVEDKRKRNADAEDRPSASAKREPDVAEHPVVSVNPEQPEERPAVKTRQRKKADKANLSDKAKDMQDDIVYLKSPEGVVWGYHVKENLSIHSLQQAGWVQVKS